MGVKEIAALMLITKIVKDGPGIINAISAAWQKVDPTAEDFEAMISVMGLQRPKDPLKKQSA